MRIVTEAEVRGELLRLELSEADFCPECCGVLQVAGTGTKAGLRCTSCYASYLPVEKEKNA